MSRSIQKAFENNKALIIYLTAGDPTLDLTEEYILSLAQNGADLIEIGIPFSDPIAEGEVIQDAMTRALSVQIKFDDIFAMVERLRKKTDIPLTFMTYINPVFSYGYDKFFKRCKDTGISAVIVPDMPFEEQGEIKGFADKYDIDIITLIAPTSQERIEDIAKNAKGFIYLVSSLGVTGVRAKITTDLKGMTEKIKEFTDIPVAVGFGISKGEQAKEIVQYADGVIIGSAIVKIIAEYKENAAIKIAEYVSDIKACMIRNK